MSLSINWFQLDFTPRSATLPCQRFSDWESSTSLIKGELKGFQTARWATPKADGKDVVLALINGQSRPSDWPEEEFDLYRKQPIAKRISENAISEYFRSRGATPKRTRFDLIVTRAAAAYPDFGVNLRTGIRLRFFSPEDGPPGFTTNWEVTAEFERTLDDDRLRRLCDGMPVLLSGGEDKSGIPQSLREYANRYIGKVTKVIDERNIEVWTRTEERVVLPANRLRLEANPSILREIERDLGNRDYARSIFRRIQELKLVLANGHRNLNLFQDQIRAIRNFFGRDVGESVLMPTMCWKQKIAVAIRLVPAQIELGGAP